ncbi:MAG: DeoR/GlpR family DNA-binding transcription regulator [Treponema sp.]|jgi:DeoR/GlpR family transcriptional regulator of sugar metabolism|nr:DeoR/GlpR family DNA-binding transcription regulator [Treponema sp.]
MDMTERRGRILEILDQDGEIGVGVLADQLAVSRVTVLKDLSELEERGLLRRERGLVMFDSTDDVGRRMARHYGIKRRIAREAARSVASGETVMIESGSCCAFLAEELAGIENGGGEAAHKNCTVITNSAFIAGLIRRAPFCRAVLLGGDYQKEAQVMVGPLARECSEHFFTDKLFIGADGFVPETGFTGKDLLRSEMVRSMARQARHTIVLTESEKFFEQGVVSLLGTEDVSDVYTDGDIPAGTEAFLLSKGVAVHKA